MTFAIRVNGGTGAGTKRPLKERRWTHDCRPPHPMHDILSWTTFGRALTTYSCPDCGTRRPDA